MLGDLGQLYVTQEVIPVYRKMLSLATVITPNWFEVEYDIFLHYVKLVFLISKLGHSQTSNSQI